MNMPADGFLSFPPWLEAFLNALAKRYVKPEQVAAMLQHVVDQLWAQVDAFVKSTPNPWDDKVAAKVKQALDECAANGDSDTICKLVMSGKSEFVRILRKIAADTKTSLDDTLVDIAAKALGVA